MKGKNMSHTKHTDKPAKVSDADEHAQFNYIQDLERQAYQKRSELKEVERRLIEAKARFAKMLAP